MGVATWVGRLIGCFKITREHNIALEIMFNLPSRILGPNTEFFAWRRRIETAFRGAALVKVGFCLNGSHTFFSPTVPYPDTSVVNAVK